MNPLRRRFLMRAAAATMAMPALARAQPRPDELALLVGGPEGGIVDKWAALLAPPLGRALTADGALRRIPAGGLDGVTAANQLVAQTTPDGNTAALLPGAAGLAWLIGDPRAHFDPAAWMPMLAVLTPSLIVLRNAAGGRAPMQRPRVALPGATTADIAALLALNLLGLDPQPVWIPTEAAPAALAEQRVDALLLRGRHMPEQIAALPADIHPLCALSGGPTPARGTEPPDFVELHQDLRGAAPAGALYDALRAVSVAGRLEIGLILPALTPSARVALWRQACTDAAASLGLQQTAMDAQAQMVGPMETAELFATLAAPPAARDALHGFIGQLHPV
jgi:hypothetical protein